MRKNCIAVINRVIRMYNSLNLYRSLSYSKRQRDFNYYYHNTKEGTNLISVIKGKHNFKCHILHMNNLKPWFFVCADEDSGNVFHHHFQYVLEQLLQKHLLLCLCHGSLIKAFKNSQNVQLLVCQISVKIVSHITIFVTFLS